ncbi:MAG: efflux RND transporter permease subunit, partial [Pseudomonadota bacterium]
EQVKDRMSAFGGIPKVEVKGFSDEQLRVEISDAVLRRYGLSFRDISQVIERQNVDLPAGTLTSKEGEILLRFSDERRAIEPLRDLVVVTDQSGGIIRLGDIATIRNVFEAEEVNVQFNGQPAALLDIVKSSTDDLITVADRLNEFLEQERQRAPPGVTFSIVADGSDIVKDRLQLLITNGLQGLLLVGLATWIFFGTRYAFWIVMGLPVAFAGGIAAMSVMGFSLNMMTMVGLLMVVGILMDDAIVISENIATKRETGLGPLEAAGAGAREVLPGVLSSFLTTVCIFGSLAFLEGDIGQVLKVIPVVMIAVLICSLVEAFLILPHHLGHALHKTERQGVVQRWANEAWDKGRRVVANYAKGAVQARYLTVGIAVGCLLSAAALLAGGIVKFSPFPALDGNTIEARILLPQGTPLERTQAIVAKIDAALERMNLELSPEQPDGANLIRSRTVRFNENADAFETGPHVATVSIDLLSSEVRTVDNDAFTSRLRQEVGQPADIIALQFTEPAIGPAGRAIDIELQGPDLTQLKAASQELQTWLSRYQGAVDLTDDLRLGKPELEITIKPEGLALGLRAEDIAQQVRAAFFGSTVAEVQTAQKSFEIDVRLAQEDREQRATLDTFVVTTANGKQVPLSAIAELTPTRGFARINRIDGQRTVRVLGDVDTRLGNASEIINDTAARFLPGLQERYPNVQVNVGGENEETATTQRSMISGFLLGLVGVFLVLSFQFRSYIEPVVVMALIPFAFIGSVLGHLLLGIDFTMPSLLGFAALSGIVVNDSILLVNQIKTRRAPGQTVAQVAPAAVGARFRAILLTSITTMFGLLPLLLETSLQAQVLIPLVTSLAFGLLASTVLVLIVVPAFYAILDDFGLSAKTDEHIHSGEPKAPTPAIATP